jgi:hypothetical protein
VIAMSDRMADESVIKGRINELLWEFLPRWVAIGDANDVSLAMLEMIRGMWSPGMQAALNQRAEARVRELPREGRG